MDANNNELRCQSAISSTGSAADSLTSTTSGSRPVSATSVGSTCSGDGSSDFVRLFRTFAKFGDSKSQGDAITLSNSDKWMRQAKLIDAKGVVTTVDTGICFKQVAKYDLLCHFISLFITDCDSIIQGPRRRLS
jgi:hypothetical protein